MTTAVSPSVGKGKNKTYDPYALRKSAKTPWGNPVVYFFSLLLVALCVGPVLYIIIGGFRTNAQITRTRPAGPIHGTLRITRRCSLRTSSGRNSSTP